MQSALKEIFEPMFEAMLNGYFNKTIKTSMGETEKVQTRRILAMYARGMS